MGSIRHPADMPEEAAPGISWYTPSQVPPSGVASNPQPNGTAIPKLFQPLKIRGLEIANRLWVSPMGQYSADDGHFTMWHNAHLGGIISRGPGLTFVEATAVAADGRITPGDSGLWKDSQKEPLRKIVEFAHSQSQKIAIQLAHAGRKASTVSPWLSRNAIATEKVGGWPDRVIAPSAIAYGENLLAMPKAMNLQQIAETAKDFAAAATRARDVGFDVIEIHAAHGYLIHEFLSPVTNKRTDRYGGSFDNRIRFLLEIVTAVRAVIPESMPLFVRISATDWLENVDEFKESWDLPQSVQLSKVLSKNGVDLIDVSSAALHPLQQVKLGPGYQAHFAQAIKQAVGNTAMVSTVGTLTTAILAESVLKSGVDAVMVGRGFQKNPGLVWQWAEELGVEMNIAKQMRWAIPGGKVAFQG